MAREHKSQIGVYADDEATEPLVIINRNINGHPTGHDGVVSDLANHIPDLVSAHGKYDGQVLGAQLIHALCGDAHHDYEYGVANCLHNDARFYYAVRPSGVTVYDARQMASVQDTTSGSTMFETAWIDPREVAKMEREVRELEDKLSAARLTVESLRRKQFKVR